VDVLEDGGSARRRELLDAAYDYVLTHGLRDLSLRPLAAAIGSSPRVLLFLFGSKEQLVAEVLDRARADELALLTELDPGATLAEAAVAIWGWLREPRRRGLLVLWHEAYGRSIADPAGPGGRFAADSVQIVLAALARTQPADVRDSAEALAQRTAVVATLRGAVLDLLATDDPDRLTAAIEHAARSW
jgi:AcrR family transcriptional regulator